MARRKPLPYHASQAIDDALMANSQAVRALVSLMNGQPVTAEERYRLIGRAIHEIHQATARLKEIRREQQ